MRADYSLGYLRMCAYNYCPNAYFETILNAVHSLLSVLYTQLWHPYTPRKIWTYTTYDMPEPPPSHPEHPTYKSKTT